MFGNESGTYYIDCSSTALSLVRCTVARGVVSVMGSAAVDANGTVDITIHMVKNPTAGTTT